MIDVKRSDSLKEEIEANRYIFMRFEYSIGVAERATL
jgi:hypothetical protein